LNFSLLTLISKEVDAVTIHKFRPIALTNCSFFLSMQPIGFVWLVRLLFLLTRQLLLKVGNILESVVCAHEISDQSSFIFKLDYEKAYDRVNRDFLFEMLRKRGL
jgi:hypothetical protein